MAASYIPFEFTSGTYRAKLRASYEDAFGSGSYKDSDAYLFTETKTVEHQSTLFFKTAYISTSYRERLSSYDENLETTRYTSIVSSEIVEEYASYSSSTSYLYPVNTNGTVYAYTVYPISHYYTSSANTITYYRDNLGDGHESSSQTVVENTSSSTRSAYNNVLQIYKYSSRFTNTITTSSTSYIHSNSAYTESKSDEFTTSYISTLNYNMSFMTDQNLASIYTKHGESDYSTTFATTRYVRGTSYLSDM